MENNLRVPLDATRAGTWTRYDPDVVAYGFATASCQHILPQPNMESIST